MPDSVGDAAQTRIIVEQVVDAAIVRLGADREDGLDEEEVDARIDRKIDRVKIWLFGVVIANLIPVIWFSYMFGQFTASVETQIGTLREAVPGQWTQQQHESYASEVDRRVTRLERYHEGGGR